LIAGGDTIFALFRDVVVKVGDDASVLMGEVEYKSNMNQFVHTKSL
jgi:hypothetical protein